MNRLSKLLALTLALIMAVMLLSACDDGKCDNCGEKATENDEALTGVEGEYCNTCLTEEILKTAGEVAADLLEKYE